MCRLFEVSRSGYYDYMKRMDNPGRDTEMQELIRTCQEISYSTYGYLRVQIWLDREKKSIVTQKLSFDAEIQSFIGDTSETIPEILEKSAQIPESAEQELPCRQTEPEVGYGYFLYQNRTGGLYLSIICNIFDNSIVAYKTGTEQNNRLVLDTVRDVMKKEGH